MNLNFFQGECSLDDRELTFSYVKNMIFIYCSEIFLYLRFDHIWCDLWLQVINMMYSRGFILIQDFEQWSRYIWYWIIQKFLVFLGCIALKMLTFLKLCFFTYLQLWCLFLFPAYLSPSNKLTALPVFVLYFFKLDSFLSIIFRKGHLLVTFWIVFKLRKSILYCIKAKKIT